MSTKRKKLRKQFEVRAITFQDLDDYQEALNSSSDHLEKFLDWGVQATTYNTQQCKSIIEMMVLDSDPNRNFAICYKGKLVGEICFSSGSRSDGLQITYWVSKKYSGLGLCSKAVQKLVDKSFLLQDINFLEIHADKRNIASIKAAKKSGFIHYDSYEYQSKGTQGIGIMDVFIYLTPRARYVETISKLQWKDGLNLDIRPDNWRRKNDLSLIRTG